MVLDVVRNDPASSSTPALTGSSTRWPTTRPILLGDEPIPMLVIPAAYALGSLVVMPWQAAWKRAARLSSLRPA